MLIFLRKIRKSLIEIESTQKYLLYALGEIALVVIGILIALQINNWNEKRKNNLLLKDSLSTLLSDLQVDSLEFNINIKKVQIELAKLDKLQSRISSDEATKDTIMKIARYEFDPGISIGYMMNNRAYNSLLQSGQINLFPAEVVNDINEYYVLYNIFNRSDDVAWEHYVNSVSQYSQNFTHSNSFLKNENVINEIWEKVDIKILAPKFSLWADHKKLVYNNFRGGLEPLIEKNKLLRSNLKKLQNSE